jgi:hypothetical protein
MWDERKQRFARKTMWSMIVESKYGLDGKEAKFDFKWIPNIGKITQREMPDEKSGDVRTGIERRNRRTAILALIVLVGLVWACWLLIRSILETIFR